MPPHSQQIFCQTRTQEIIDSILERIEIGLDRHYCLAHTHTVFYDIAKVNTCSGKAFERFLNHRKTSPFILVGVYVTLVCIAPNTKIVVYIGSFMAQQKKMYRRIFMCQSHFDSLYLNVVAF